MLRTGAEPTNDMNINNLVKLDRHVQQQLDPMSSVPLAVVSHHSNGDKRDTPSGAERLPCNFLFAFV